MTFEALRNRLQSTATFLPDLPEETPDATLRALWLLAAGEAVSSESAVAPERTLPSLSAEQQAHLAQLVDQRIQGVPLAHLTQRQRFLGLDMICGADALVPRKETELLARTAIERANAIVAERGHCRVVDVCTGCGNVALAVAHRVHAATVFGADLSEPAVALAKRNARHLQLAVDFRVGDLLEPFRSSDFLGQVDVLTCNPPYISSGKVTNMPGQISSHEPRMAFDGGPLGISILMRLLNEAPAFVRPGGWLAFEVGLGQGPAMIKRMQANPVFREVVPVMDAAGAIRTCSARL